MRTVVALGILFISSVSLAWNKKAVQAYSGAATYEQLFCQAGASTEACRHYKKTLGSEISAKPLPVTVEDSSTLVVSSNKSTVRAKNTGPSTIYEVNGKRMDLLGFSAAPEVRENINAVVPRVAQAEGAVENKQAPPAAGEVDLKVVASLDFLIVRSQEMNSCEGLVDFVSECISNAYELDAAVIQSKSAWDGAQIAARVKQIEVAKEYTQRLDKLAVVLQRSSVSWSAPKLQECANRFDPTLPNNFKLCRETLKQYDQALKVMNQRMQTQRAQEVIDKQLQPALAAPTKKTPAGNAGGTR